MQDLYYKAPDSSIAMQLTKYLLMILACLLIWFIPTTQKICQQIDILVFNLLNGSLEYSHAWQLIWGYLNHPNETWLNVVLMMGLNIAGVYSLPPAQRKKAFAGVVYFWLFFQIVIIITHFIFHDIFAVTRPSPTLVLKDFVNLSQNLDMPLKIASTSCFPAGHALVVVYWARFSMLYSKPRIQRIILATATILFLPRLFSGAHWFSDIVFTTFYALLWYNLAIATPLQRWIIRPAKLIGVA